MAIPVNSPQQTEAIPGGQLVNVSASQSVSWAPIPFRGVIVGASATISAAITVANSTVTVKSVKSGTSTTIGTIVLAFSGSAAGSTFLASITGSEIARSVNQGDAIAFDCDGASTTTSIGNFEFLLRS